MGYFYIKLERYQEADQQFRSVLRIDLNHREALLKIASLAAAQTLPRRHPWSTTASSPSAQTMPKPTRA